MSRQQDIITALKTLLATITTANGYETDIGQNVREWEIAADESEAPFVDVRDDDDILISQEGAFVYRMPLNIVVVSTGKTARENARKMAYDVYKALGTKPTLDGEADKISPSRMKLLVDRGSALVAGVVITVMVTFSTAPWQDE